MHCAFLVHSKRLDCLVLSQSETVIMLRRRPVYLLRLLPAFACLGLSKWRLTPLGPVVIETIQFDGEFRWTQWHRHIDLVWRPWPLVRRIKPDLAIGKPLLAGT